MIPHERAIPHRQVPRRFLGLVGAVGWGTASMLLAGFLLCGFGGGEAAASERTGGTCSRPGYLIVTADSAPAAARPPIVEAVRESGLVDFKSRRFALSLATLGDIRDFCEGAGCPFERDRPAAIRRYVRSVYREALDAGCPLRYLLLIGPFEALPQQLIWALPEEKIEIRFSRGDARPHRLGKGAPPPELNVRPHFTDLYYEDMDGEWERNGNGVLAEVYDLTGTCNCLEAYDPTFCDTDDLRAYLPEIAMGRIPMRSRSPAEVAQVRAMLQRITRYQSERPGTMKDLLFVAAPFLVPGDSAWLMEASKARIAAWQADHPEAPPSPWRAPIGIGSRNGRGGNAVPSRPGIFAAPPRCPTGASRAPSTASPRSTGSSIRKGSASSSSIPTETGR